MWRETRFVLLTRKKSLKAHAGLGPPLRKAFEAGGKDFDTINRKCGKL